MLIQPKTINANDVITIKLVGGDEVVARLLEDNGHQLVVKRPLVVAMAQQGFGLMPFALTIEPETPVEISHSHIICFAKTIKDVTSHYTQQTSGIVM